MMTLQTQDQYITTILQTKFHNDKTKFMEAVKEFFQTSSKVETYEYNLLKAYDEGELSLGQVAKFLDISKEETMALLEKYDIPYIRVDEAYLEQEFNAFN